MKHIATHTKHGQRAQATVLFLSGRKDLFDRITKDEQGGRVGWAERMPQAYNNKQCLPWNEVRGRYWYPWKN